MSKERRLGRGLEALLGRSFDATASELSHSNSNDQTPAPALPPADAVVPTHGSYNGGDAAVDIARSADGQQWIAAAAIDRNPYQPRQTFDETEIADLCDSIRTHGFLQPIVVRRAGDRFQLIAGERRLRAAQMAAWDRVPVQVREVNDRELAELAIVENLQRKDLNAIEKASSFQRYMQEYDCTHEDLAMRLSLDRSTVSNLIRLLDLPGEVRSMITRGELTAGHGRALLPLGEEHEQIDFARRIIKDGLSVRAVEQGVAEHIQRADGEPLSIVDRDGNSRPSPLQPGQHLRDLEEQLRMALGAKVELKQSAKGRGKVTIHFSSHEEFDRLRTLLISAGSTQTGVI